MTQNTKAQVRMPGSGALVGFGLSSLAVFIHGQLAFAGGKHVHGEGRLDVAIETPSQSTAESAQGAQNFPLVLRYQLPGDTLFGFEHEPKNDKERQVISEMLTQVRTGAQQWLTLPAELGCTSWAVEASEPQKHAPKEDGKKKKAAEHNEVVVTVKGTCTKDPLGSKVAFDGFKTLKRLHVLEIQIVGRDTQTGLRLRRKKPEFTLGTPPTTAKP